MNDGRTLYVTLAANTAAFRGQLLAAGTSVRALGDDVLRTANHSDEMRQGMARVGLMAGGAMLAGLAAGVYMNMKLQKSMLNVATISSEVRDNMGEFTDAIVEMSTKVPQSAESLSEGLYDIVSSGFSGSEALVILGASAKAASAGMTDAQTATSGILTVLNAYGKEASEAADIADIMFQTVNLGILSFEELAAALGGVVPTAAAAGIEFDDLAAGIAAITLSGIGAESASTDLNNTIAKILVPSEAMGEALTEIGFESGYAALQAKGLKGTIDLLAKSQGTAADTAFKLFPQIQSARGYMALTAAGGKNYATTFDGIANAITRAEAAQKAYNIQSQSDAAKAQRAVSSLQALGIKAGQMFQPALSSVLSFGESFIGVLNAIPGPALAVVVGLFAMSAIVLVLGGGYLKLSASLVAYRAALGATTAASAGAAAAMRTLQLSMGVIGVIMLAATAIYGIYNARKKQSEQVTNDFVEALKQEGAAGETAALNTLIGKMVDGGDIDKLKAAGLDVGVAVKGITGSAADWNAAMDAIDAKRKERENTAAQESGYIQQIAIAERNLAIVRERVAKTPSSTAGQDRRALDQSERQLKNAQMGLQAAKDAQNKNNADLDKAEASLKSYRSSMEEAREETKLMQEAQKASTEAIAETAPALSRILARIAPFKDGVVQLTSAQKALIQVFADFQSPMKAFQDAVKDGSASLDEFSTNLEKQARDMSNYMTNLGLLAKRGRTDLVEEFVKMGPEASGLVAEAVDASEAELNRLGSAFSTISEDNVLLFNEGMRALPVIAASKGKATVDSLASAFTGGKADEMVLILKTLRKNINDIPTKHMIDMVLNNAVPVQKMLNRFASKLEKMPTSLVTEIRANGIPKSMNAVLALQRRYNLTDAEVVTLLNIRDNTRAPLSDVLARLDGVDGYVATPSVSLNNGGMPGQVSSLMSSLLNLGNTTVRPTIAPKYIQGKGPLKVYGAGGADGNPATPQENGGLLVNGVRAFADGGWGEDGRYHSRTPQIVQGGANILWGEKATGWEAYISGKSGEKKRNVEILGQAAARFGYDIAPRGRERAGRAANGGRINVTAGTSMPESVFLNIGGASFKAFVRNQAGQEINSRVARAAEVEGTSERMTWG